MHSAKLLEKQVPEMTNARGRQSFDGRPILFLTYRTLPFHVSTERIRRTSYDWPKPRRRTLRRHAGPTRRRFSSRLAFRFHLWIRKRLAHVFECAGLW